MCPVGGRIPGEDGWGGFKATPPEKLRETSRLVTFLIYAFLTLVGGVVGAVVVLGLETRYGGLAGDPSWTILAVAGLGFAIGAGWVMAAIFGNWHQSRGAKQRHEAERGESERFWRGDRQGDDGNRSGKDNKAGNDGSQSRRDIRQ